MESATHLLTGAALASLKIGAIAVDDPAVIGCTLAAAAPDLDIVTQLMGQTSYLKSHRGFSHSFPGLGIQGLIITTILYYLFPASSFLSIFLWTGLGLLSHVGLDLLNSYGVKILWPDVKKYFFDILPLFDPVLFCLLALSFFAQGTAKYMLVFGALVGYPSLRLLLRQRARHILEHSIDDIEFLRVMPATFHPFKWDYITKAAGNTIVGQLANFTATNTIRTQVKNYDKKNPLVRQVIASNLGRFFTQFSPLHHYEIEKCDKGYLVKLYDLRYTRRGRFMHSGTAVFDHTNKLQKTSLHPYSPKIEIAMD